MSLRDELERVMGAVLIGNRRSVPRQDLEYSVRVANDFFRDHGQALLEAVDENEKFWELVCWNIDNFRDLPLTDGYYAKWLDKAEAILALTKTNAGEGA